MISTVDEFDELKEINRQKAIECISAADHWLLLASEQRDAEDGMVEFTGVVNIDCEADIAAHMIIEFLKENARVGEAMEKMIKEDPDAISGVQKLVISGRFPSLNETIAAAKSHWSAYSKEKKRITGSVALLAVVQGLVPVEGMVHIETHWYEKNKRRDPDNVRVGLKWILDGLIQAKILPGDGWSTIDSLQDVFHIDKENPRVEVMIFDRQNDYEDVERDEEDLL